MQDLWKIVDYTSPVREIFHRKWDHYRNWSGLFWWKIHMQKSFFHQSLRWSRFSLFVFLRETDKLKYLPPFFWKKLFMIVLKYSKESDKQLQHERMRQLQKIGNWINKNQWTELSPLGTWFHFFWKLKW